MQEQVEKDLKRDEALEYCNCSKGTGL